MSLLKTVEIRESPFQHYLNTNTLLDVHTGVFVPGTHGGMILNGGLSSSNSFSGRPRMFKSTEMFSYVVRAMCYYSRTEFLIYDTEFAQKANRLAEFAPVEYKESVQNRIIITDPAVTSAEEFIALVKSIADSKLKNKDDYLVESPILDPKTMKPQMMLIPTFVAIDSWSKMVSSYMTNTLETKQLGSSDTNMVYMKDGNVKKMIMTQIPALAARAGIYFVMSAHVGEKYEMNQYAPSPKQLQYMKANEKLKEVGADFNFLMSNAIEMRKVAALLNGDKSDTLYPKTGSSQFELNEVTSILTGCKNNMAGYTLPMVVSQLEGIMPELSNYNYLREHEYFGLVGNKNTHKPVFTDTTVGRTTIREKLSDPKLVRALEILTQLCYIQQNWVTANSDIDFFIKPEKLQELLLEKDKNIVNDILESRGYWTYDKNDQTYLSLYDIIAIVQNKYTPKFISVKS